MALSVIAALITLVVILIVRPLLADRAARSWDPERFRAILGSDIVAEPAVHYPARDGTNLPVRVYGEPSVPNSIVVIHGSASHSRYLAPLARALVEGGRLRVFTPDVRGHGASPKRRGDIDYVDQLEDELADLLDWIQASSPAGAEPPIIAGHSSGGGFALRFAGGKYAHRVRRLIMLAPFLGHRSPTTRSDSGGWAKPFLERIIPLAVLEGFGIDSLGGITTLSLLMPPEARDGTETLRYSYRLMMGFAPRDYQEELNKLVPGQLLVIIGSKDEAFHADRFKPLIEKYAPGSETLIIDDATHLGIVSNQQAIALTRSWIEGE